MKNLLCFGLFSVAHLSWGLFTFAQLLHCMTLKLCCCKIHLFFYETCKNTVFFLKCEKTSFCWFESTQSYIRNFNYNCVWILIPGFNLGKNIWQIQMHLYNISQVEISSPLNTEVRVNMTNHVTTRKGNIQNPSLLHSKYRTNPGI